MVRLDDFERGGLLSDVRVVFAQHRRITGVARSIFGTRMIGCVKTIQNYLFACFRSKNWFAWIIFRNWPPWYFSVVTLPSSFENASITILDTQSFMETSLPADELSNALSLEILAHFFIEI